MVGQDEEVIAMLAVPARHLVGCGVAVAVEGVGMRVPLVPLERRRRLRVHLDSAREPQGEEDLTTQCRSPHRGSMPPPRRCDACGRARWP